MRGTETKLATGLCPLSPRERGRTTREAGGHAPLDSAPLPEGEGSAREARAGEGEGEG